VHRGYELMRENTRISLAAACTSFACVYVVIAALKPRLLIDPDTFLHITVGEWILQNRSFPTADTFSYTRIGQRWIATDWIAEVIFAILYSIGRWGAVTEIVAATSGLISGILTFYFARNLRLSLALGLPIIITLLISTQFLARPVIFSFLLITIWIALILQLEDNGWRQRWAYVLIPLMLLWANVHASFTFGLVVAYFFLCNAVYQAYIKEDVVKLRRLVGLLAGITVAALVTPYGPLSALRTLHLMSIPALAQIDEWHAPDFQNDPIHLASIVGVFALIAYSGMEIRGPRLFTLLLVTVLALEHRRGLNVFALVAPLLLARPLATWAPYLGVQHVLDPVARFADKKLAAIAIACLSLLLITGVMRWVMARAVQPPSSAAPERAIAAAKAAGVTGHMLNSYGFGGYLIFSGIQPLIDGRVDLYGNEFLQRYFSAMRLTDENDAKALLKQYDVRWALLRPHAPIAFMLKTDGWVELYRDDNAIVLAKRP
jgi:hypothetical protein